MHLCPVENPRTKRTDGTPYLKKGCAANKRPIVALVERGGNVRTFHVPVCDGASVGKSVRENIARESRLRTDESNLYPDIAGKWFQRHDTVKHTAGEYVRYDDDAIVHTNSAEGYLINLQTRDAWRLSALQREAFAPLPCRIRSPL
jgi:hypothetical protein